MFYHPMVIQYNTWAVLDVVTKNQQKRAIAITHLSLFGTTARTSLNRACEQLFRTGSEL